MLSKIMQETIHKGSAIRRAFEEGQRLSAIYGKENVFDLSIGNPGAPVPDIIAEKMRLIADEPPKELHSYMTDAGFEKVREDIAENINRRFGTKFTYENIIMSNGAAGAMNIFMHSVMDPGDEVMVMKPYYPGYSSFILNRGGRKVEVEPFGEDFQPDLDDFKNKISELTKIVILNSPNNPSGAIYSEDTIINIARILNEKQKEYGHDIYILSDEPYRELNYTEENIPYVTKLYDNTVVAYSFSKSLSIPGERIGYLVVPDEVNDSKDLIKAVRMSTGMLGFINANAFFQKVVAACLNVEAPVEYYRKNRDLLYDTLTRLGFECIRPKGAFYIFVKAPDGDEEDFLAQAHSCNIILVGGKTFGLEGYARVSFCGSYEAIKNASKAFEKLASICFAR